ncbi:MAG: hypothetical protein UY76_C0065G0003 [Candidatus Uhrbacteria bacterium GW2011_GWA2_52_8d]|uniref:Uncharacterized protein n=1 Tax=Candidatus Uhrbacteria bacterium GW2011_GWA2_52_8d TaxID=1618979 RepID=A0A0G1XJV8_9BACT|nr:MAG: hypothetical protein UY76_C0065G0003 [Candidatus Uhrbacteria bacterium GW2011_GWA2_52_8d]
MTQTNTPAPTPTAPVADLSMIPALSGRVNASLNLDFSRPFVQQIQAYLEGLGNDARGLRSVALVDQGVAAILMLPALEMLGGLPTVVFKGFGQDAPVVSVDLSVFRHNEVRLRRAELAHGEAFAGFTVLDGSGRGLTPVQLTELAALLNCEEGSIRTMNVQAGTKGQVDLTSAKGAVDGMADLLIQTGLTVEDWTSGRVIFLPGGMGNIGALQATAVHGLSEAWPRTIRLAADTGKVFHVAEVVDPQAMRQWAVGLAARLDGAIPVAVLSGEIPEAFRAALAVLAAEHGVEIRG